MLQFQNLSSQQLQKIIAIKEQIEELEKRIDAIAADKAEPEGGIPVSAASETRKKRRKVSAAGRARIAAGARARWAKIKGEKEVKSTPVKKAKRRLSRAGKAAIIAATKERWARFHAAQTGA